MCVTAFAKPLPVHDPISPTQLIEGRKLVLQARNGKTVWIPVPFRFKVFTDKEVGRGSTRICYEALGESGGIVYNMVAKQLINHKLFRGTYLEPYIQTMQAYMGVAKYLKRFQDDCEKLYGIFPVYSVIQDLKVSVS